MTLLWLHNFWKTPRFESLAYNQPKSAFGTHIAEFNYRDVKAFLGFSLATLASTLQIRAIVLPSFQKQTLRKYSQRRALTSLPADSLLHPGCKTLRIRGSILSHFIATRDLFQLRVMLLPVFTAW